MIITKRPFKLKQVLMNLEPGQISVDANKRDSLIKMGREAGVGGGVGQGSIKWKSSGICFFTL